MPRESQTYPQGMSSLPHGARRYRYAGKERDEESGLYYFGARYYAPWLGRFLSVDPKAGEYIHQSTYCYAANNPVTLKDVNGEGPGDINPDNDTIFIDSVTGKVLGVFDATTFQKDHPGVGPGFRSISAANYDSLLKNGFKPINEGESSETSLKVDSKEVNINIQSLKDALLWLGAKPGKDSDGYYKERSIYFVFDRKSSEIRAEIIPDEKNTNSSSDAPAERWGAHSTYKGMVIIGGLHTHPLYQGGKEMDPFAPSHPFGFDGNPLDNGPGTSFPDFKSSKNIAAPVIAVGTYLEDKVGKNPDQVSMWSILPNAKNGADFKVVSSNNGHDVQGVSLFSVQNNPPLSC